MENRMVSIIVPVYNVESYLRSCIDSLLGQTYGNIQIILVDDGSPDNCGAICDEYAAKDSRVLALHKPNGGVSSARNLGLEYVRGTYLTFCDGDDAYRPDWIQQLTNALEESQSDTAVGCFVKVFDDGTVVSEDSHETGIWETDSEVSRINYCFDMLMSSRHGWEITTRLFRSEIIQKNNIRFSEECGNYAEDLGFTLVYSMLASRVISTDCSGYLYNIRGSSMMQTSAAVPKLESMHQVYLFVEPQLRKILSPNVSERVLRGLYLQMIGLQFISKLWSSEMEPEQLRQVSIAGVKDWPDMQKRLRHCMQGRNEWNPCRSESYYLELISHMKFLLGGSWMGLRIRCKLIRMFRPVIDWLGSNCSRTI